MAEDTRVDASAQGHRHPQRRVADRPESEGGLNGWRTPEGQEKLRLEGGNPQHLLVCLDRSPESERLLRHAAALAKVWRARVTYIHVLETGPRDELTHPADPVDWQLRRHEGRRYLAETMARYAREDLKIGMALAEGRAFEEIQVWSESHAVDLTILSTHGEKGRTGCGLSGTAYKLIDGSSGSCLVVPAGDPADMPDGEVSYRRILVPLDGSLHAESVLPIATKLAAAQRAEFVLAHVVAVPELIGRGLPTAEDRSLEQAVIERNESVARHYLDEIRTRVQHPRFRVRTHLSREGSPRDELLRFIHDEAIDLVVMSAHGMTGATDRALGSTAAHLVAHSRVPLLVSRQRTAPRLREDRASSASHREAARLPSAITA